MIVTFSGLDGTGKTTCVDMASEHIYSKVKTCRRRHIIKDSLSHFFTHKIVGGVSGEARKSAEAGLRETTKGIKGNILVLVKKIFLLIDIIFFDVVYGRYKGKKDKAIVCDRYFYDELVQTEYLGIAGRVFTRLYSSLIIRPDIAFILKISPDEAYSRKNEYDIDYFRKKEGLYENISKKEGLSTIPPASISEVGTVIKEGIDGILPNIRS